MSSAVYFFTLANIGLPATERR